MFFTACIILLIIEVATLTLFILGKVKKKKVNENVIFLGAAYVINLLSNLIPYLYKRIILNNEGNIFFEVIKNIITTPKAFVGLVDFDGALEFAQYISIYPYVFLLASLIAVLGTVSVTIETFLHQILNGFKVPLLLSRKKCDIVIGTSKVALDYAKGNKECILLSDVNLPKEKMIFYISQGYKVINKVFNEDFLFSRMFNNKTQYNIIYFTENNDFLKYMNFYLQYKKKAKSAKNIRLFLEVGENKTETIRREIVEKNHCEDSIVIFSRHELVARDFVEKYPITKYLPKECILDDGSLKSSENIHIFFLGTTNQSEELFKQFSMNNQLVSFENKEYKIHKINYHFYDEAKKNDSFIIKDLLNELKALNANDYIDIPEAPFNISYKNDVVFTKEIINEIKDVIKEKETYAYIIVDLDDEFRDVELGVRIKTLLSKYNNYHVFVNGCEEYHVNEEKLTYYGSTKTILSHNVIVNDELSIIARTVNKMYYQEKLIEYKEKENYNALVERQANESWINQSYFSMYSNIYSALSLRIKLNLLGLDYVADGKKENLELISQRYNEGLQKESYFIRSKRNALLAHEHARWNAYHLLNEFMPLKKDDITYVVKDGKVKFTIKDMEAKKHACLISFKGLDKLSIYLANQASKLLDKELSKEEYDYYIYDEALIRSAKGLLEELGYSVKEL